MYVLPGSARILYTCGVHVALASNLPSITSTSVLAYTFVCAYIAPFNGKRTITINRTSCVSNGPS